MCPDGQCLLCKPPVHSKDDLFFCPVPSTVLVYRIKLVPKARGFFHHVRMPQILGEYLAEAVWVTILFCGQEALFAGCSGELQVRPP